MANVSGPQPDVKFCPACTAELRNLPRNEMKWRGKKADGTISQHTHTYACNAPKCEKKFEINQDQ
jgi:uncharacterized protein with PIN domain